MEIPKQILEEYIWPVIKDFVFPLIVGIVTFNMGKKEKKRNAIPDITPLKLDTKKQYRTNEDFIEKYEQFIWFERRKRSVDENLATEEQIVFARMKNHREICKKIEENKKIYIISFKGIQYPLSVRFLFYDDGLTVPVDKDIVPVYLEKDKDCCFVCPLDSKPMAIFGNVNESAIWYNLKEDNRVEKKIHKRQKRVKPGT